MSMNSNDGTYLGDVSHVTSLLSSKPNSSAKLSFQANISEREVSTGDASEAEVQSDMKSPFHPIYPEADRHTLLSYLHDYFQSSNSTFWIFPKFPFLEWVENQPKKSHWDVTLIRAMLALGSQFTHTQESQMHGNVLSTMVLSALMQENEDYLDLRIVQARIFIALYHFRIGNEEKARRLVQWALSGARMEGLHIERTTTAVSNDESALYGFNQAVLYECRRRTFWAAYVLNCFESTDEIKLTISGTSPCYLQLPCDEKLYEQGMILPTPMFTSAKSLEHAYKSEYHQNIGFLGYWVEMASIWDDIHVTLTHQQLHPQKQDSLDFQRHHQRISHCLQIWKEFYYSFAARSVSRTWSGQLGTGADIITSLHFLYQGAMIRLHRHIALPYLKERQIAHMIRITHSHAMETLKMARRLYEQRVQEKEGVIGFMSMSASTGYSIMAAVDVSTSTGLFQTLLDVRSQQISYVAGALDVIEELAKTWPSIASLRQCIADRYQILLAAGFASTQGKKAYWIREPIDRSFGIEKDLMYIMPRKTVMLALGYDVEHCDEEMFVEITDGAGSSFGSH